MSRLKEVLLEEQEVNEGKMDNLYLVKRKDGYYFIANLKKVNDKLVGYKLEDGSSKQAQEDDQYVQLGRIALSKVG